MSLEASYTNQQAAELRLDQLISSFLQLEYELKLAILSDDTETVEDIDSKIGTIETQIREFDCKTSNDKKRLGAFLVDHYLANEENAKLIPAGITDKLKELIG